MNQIIKLKRSKQYFVLIAVLHFVALAAFLILSIIFLVKVLCILGTILSFLYILYIYQTVQLEQIELINSNKLVLQTKQSTVKAQILNSSVITEFYICLYCKCIDSGKKHYFVLMKDSFKDKVQYRAFSAWLKQVAI